MGRNTPGAISFILDGSGAAAVAVATASSESSVMARIMDSTAAAGALLCACYLRTVVAK